MNAERRAAVVKWVVLGWIGAAAVVPFAGCQDRPAGGGVVTPAAVTKTVYTRDEFRKLVVGKTPDEVIAAVGKPDDTSESGSVSWTYMYRTKDPITGKTDVSAIVVFEDGRVDRVRY